VSTEGHIGLAPGGAQVGDLITVLLGCPSPMILRAKNNYYQVVGETYCDGIMDGEAILGLLPDHYQVVRRMEPSTGGLAWACMDCRNGNIQLEDPRLGLMPQGWQTVRYTETEEMYYQRFVHESENGMTFSDPRLTPNALKERGINLLVFDLV